MTLAGVIGLCLGSFAATAAVRMARREQALFGRSHCDHCGVPLGFLQTAPVLSYVHQRGACAACGGGIDPVHLVGEVSAAVMLTLACLVVPAGRGIAVAALGLILLTSVLVDARTRRLPDGLTLAAALICAVLAASHSMTGLLQGLGVAAAAFAVLQAVRLGFRRWRGQEAMGFGDVKLIAALALWLGLLTPWVVCLAAVLGLAAMAILRPADGRLPFGPAIALAAWTLGLASELNLWPGLA